MKCSDEGLRFIMEFEGCVLAAYPDPATGGEPWTIGVGHTGGVQPGDTCTEEQALAWLRDDAGTAERCVNASVKGQLTQQINQVQDTKARTAFQMAINSVDH
ncbi:MAG: lysozyme, partial [Armatimonadota bacterium]|nr:lysozyme [Armatimonadota bacterium]